MTAPPPTPHHHRSIAALGALYRARSLSPVEVVAEQIRRIEAHNHALNAFTVVDYEGSLAAAQASEERWRHGAPLSAVDGVTFTAKDNFMVAGFPYRRGSLATPAEPVTETSPAVARMREGGAVLVGLTTMPEFGAGAVTNSPLSGITRNPWDASRHAGGSSGGGAASVAAGFCTVALGSDAGGSVRIPAALCGVLGFKCTGGALPVYPPSFVGNVSSPGPLTRSVDDALAVLALMAKPDSRDPFSLPGGLGTDDVADMAGMRVAFSLDMGYAPYVDPDVARLVRQAAGMFADFGCVVSEDHPHTGSPLELFVTLTRASYRHTLAGMSAADKAKLGPVLQAMLADDADVSIARYLETKDRITALAQSLAAFHDRYDLLITPTVAAPAFDASRAFPAAFETFDNPRAWTPFASLFNLTEQPAVSVPIGLTRDGLPAAMQIVGRRGSDYRVLRAAARYLDATGPLVLPELP